VNGVGVHRAELSRRLSLDLSVELAIIDASHESSLSNDQQVSDFLVDDDLLVSAGRPWPDSVMTDEPAWNNSPSSVRTQRHVMRHRQYLVSYKISARALPETHLRRSPRPSSRLVKGYSPPFLTPSSLWRFNLDAFGFEARCLHF